MNYDVKGKKDHRAYKTELQIMELNFCPFLYSVGSETKNSPPEPQNDVAEIAFTRIVPNSSFHCFYRELKTCQS